LCFLVPYAGEDRGQARLDIIRLEIGHVASNWSVSLSVFERSVARFA
jgi:hypothetical protein